jgi:cell division protein FtsL
VKLKKSSAITKIVILALIIYAVASFISVRSKTAEALQEKTALQQKVTQMSEANAELQYGIDHSTDDQTIEDIAREKLGLVKPGEVIFYDTGD